MSANSRLTLAVHALTLLAWHEQDEDGLTSQRIAHSVNTNPVILRELLGMMEKQHLVSVQRGCNAGWKLARAPERIRLLDVYYAVKPHTLFALHHTPPNPKCVIGHGIGSTLQGIYDGVQHTLEQELARTTIADVLRDTLACSPVERALERVTEPATAGPPSLISDD
jgi:DNA-binding IscR family transcriptional regulator